MHAILYSGGGDYTDPWHPFSETSAIVAGLLTEAGFDVDVTAEVEAGLARLADGGPELVVVNCGTGGTPTPRDRAVETGLLAHLGRGGGILALHTASTVFTEWPEWAAILGGRWIRGTSMHPPLAPFAVEVSDAAELGVPDAGFVTQDEAYSLLQVSPSARVLATHTGEGARQPIWWLNEWRGARIAYDALGHDVDAYRAEPQRDFIRRAGLWCVRSG